MKVLVLAPEAFHLGYVSCYGNPWIETPSLDALAASAVLFDQHFADRPDASGARQAWRTGRYELPNPQAVLPNRAQKADLVQLLREHGVVTALVSNGRSAASRDFAVGWEQVATLSAAGEITALDRATKAVRRLLQQLAMHESWLLWVDLGTLVPPWQVPVDFQERYAEYNSSDDDETDTVENDETGNNSESSLAFWSDPPLGLLDPDDDEGFGRLQRSYAAAMTYLDAGIGQLLDIVHDEALDDKGLDDEVVVVFTADRGLALGEHRLVGEMRPWLHEERIHLPLLVRLPGAAQAGRRCSALTQSVDLMPTLLDLFGVPAAACHGHSLMPLMQGATERIRAYGVSVMQSGGAVEWALRTPHWSFLFPIEAAPPDVPRGAQLYVQPDDRWEVNNVLQHHQELAEGFEHSLRQFITATRCDGPFQAPPLADKVLQAIGSESGTEPRSGSADPRLDPS